MEKKQYIQPQIKSKVVKCEGSFLQQGTEQTSNPWDWNSLSPDDPEDPVFEGKDNNVWEEVDY